MNQSGFRCIGAFDIDVNAVATYNANSPNEAIQHDLATPLPENSEYSEADLIISGSPCQGFSTAGKRRIDDPRNNLLIRSGEIAINLSPKVYVAENVLGVISGKHKKYWDALHTLFRLNGYKTKDYKIDCSKIGVPQKRNRMIFIAWQDKLDFQLGTNGVRPKNLRDALKNIEDAQDHAPNLLEGNSSEYHIAKRIGPGQKLCNVRGGEKAIPTWTIPEVFGPVSKKSIQVLEAIRNLRRKIRLRDFGDADPVLPEDINNFLGFNAEKEILSLTQQGHLKKVGTRVDLTRTYNGKYRRLCWDSPSLTVDTVFGNPKYFLHPEEHRGFSVREAARIQSFPDDFSFSGPESVKYRMIGNAVPPALGKHIGKAVRDHLKD